MQTSAQQLPATADRLADSTSSSTDLGGSCSSLRPFELACFLRLLTLVGVPLLQAFVLTLPQPMAPAFKDFVRSVLYGQ